MNLIIALLFIATFQAYKIQAFDDTCGCLAGVSYTDYGDACGALNSTASNESNNYLLVYHDVENGPYNININTIKQQLSSFSKEILIFIGNPGHSVLNNKYVEKLIKDCRKKYEAVVSLSWSLAIDVDDCGDLLAEISNAGKTLIKILHQFNDCGVNIGNIRVITLGSGFYVAGVAANIIASSPQQMCFQYIYAIQPTNVPIDLSEVTCKTIAVYDNPGACADISPKATVNVIIGNSTCSKDDIDCLLAWDLCSTVIKVLNNEIPLYQCFSWEKALAGNSYIDKIKIQVASLSPGYYITNSVCFSGNVNVKTIKSTNNLITSDSEKFDQFCGCEIFDYNNLEQFCNVQSPNKTELIENPQYYLKLLKLTVKDPILKYEECPRLSADQEVIILVSDISDDTADDFGNDANRMFIRKATLDFALDHNVIVFFWTYNKNINDCTDLFSRIQEAGSYLSFFLNGFVSACNIPFNKLNFFAFGNGNHVLSVAIEQFQAKVNLIIAIRPTPFPLSYGDWAKQLIVFHQKPGTCSTWYADGQVNIIVNDPIYSCKDDNCDYGYDLVDYIFIKINLFGTLSLYKCDSWSDAIANIPSNSDTIKIVNLNITSGYYITTLTNTCPTNGVPNKDNQNKEKGLINIDLNLLSKLL